MNEIMTNTTLDITSEAYEKAVRLHRDIMANGQLAADAFVEFCRCLKQMRDVKLYTELGYADFEDYTVRAVGLKQRQAYSYISTYEKLGKEFLQSNATLGITKLELLASVPLFDRDGVTEENDIGGMSVTEVRELVAKYDASREQLSLLQMQVDNGEADSSAAEDERLQLMQQVRELKEQLAAVPEADDDAATKERDELLAEVHELKEQLANVPEDNDMEAIIADLEEEIRAREHEELQKLRVSEREVEKREAAAEKKRLEKDSAEKLRLAQEKARADADALVKAAEEKARESVTAATKQAQELARQQIEDSLAGLESEKTEALARARELEQKLKVAANPDTALIQFQFELVQEAIGKITDCIVRMAITDAEAAERFREAARKLLAALSGQL